MTLRATRVLPAPDPSTAGARWLFAEREYLRRVGHGKKSKATFAKLRRRLESSSDADLKLRLSEVQIARRTTPSLKGDDFLLAEQLTIQAELGWRRREGRVDENRMRRYRELISAKAIVKLLQDGNADDVRRALLDAAEEIRETNLPPGLEPQEVVNSIVEYVAQSGGYQARED